MKYLIFYLSILYFITLRIPTLYLNKTNILNVVYCHFDWRYIDVLRCVYDLVTMTVHIQDKRTRPIFLRRRVRQGSAMSPKLFTATQGGSVFKTYVSHLYDCETLEKLGQMLDGPNESYRRAGLGMNLDKMTFNFNN